ncbi:hypothetical protein ACU4GD_20495 [Cupriavidus basilensis]
MTAQLNVLARRPRRARGGGFTGNGRAFCAGADLEGSGRAAVVTGEPDFLDVVVEFVDNALRALPQASHRRRERGWRFGGRAGNQ